MVRGSALVRPLTGLQRASVVHVSEMLPSNCRSRGDKSDTCATGNTGQLERPDMPLIVRNSDGSDTSSPTQGSSCGPWPAS